METLIFAVSEDIPTIWYVAPFSAAFALIMAFVFSRGVMKHSEGDDNMIEIAQAVRDGAMAYLRRQYKVVFGVFIVLIAVLSER